MGLDFTAIDFETANRQRASVCQVGMARVRDGKVVDRTSWLIQPPTGVESGDFDPSNIIVHGIRHHDVADAPTWHESLERISEYVGDDVLVAHYAQFDSAVMHRAAEKIGAQLSGDIWRCSHALSRSHLVLPKYSLPEVADALNITGLRHHDASSDAFVCAQIVLDIAAITGANTIDELWPPTAIKPSLRTANGKAGKDPTFRSTKKSDLPAANLEAPQSHELYGQHVTITGGFSRLGRTEAFSLAAERGATIEIGTTLKTTILVIADEDPYADRFDLASGSTKMRKAHKYITERGKKIRIMDEQEFYAAVGLEKASRPVRKVKKPRATDVSSIVRGAEAEASKEIPVPRSDLAAGKTQSILEETAEPQLAQGRVEPRIARGQAGSKGGSMYPVNPTAGHKADSAGAVGRSQGSFADQSPRSRGARALTAGLKALAIGLFVITAFFALCVVVGFTEISAGAGIFFAIGTIATGIGGMFAWRGARRRHR